MKWMNYGISRSSAYALKLSETGCLGYISGIIEIIWNRLRRYVEWTNGMNCISEMPGF